ncbi:MAG: hypothetical protein HUU25_05720 [Candidatus Sumerlaeia bacterium]|nr:hypothetical protein [Candidatus Sumerlaeia bacterium]
MSLRLILGAATTATALTLLPPEALATAESEGTAGIDPNPGMAHPVTEAEGSVPPAPPPSPQVRGAIGPSTRQPVGALTGRIVFCGAGHGWTANTTGTGQPWYTQRGDNFEVVEDLGNQDQLTMFVAYAWNAGATVVPMRPVGHQPNEVVLDNDDPGVVFNPPASWGNGGLTPYYGSSGDVRYRVASKSAVESATATYTPDIPQAGFYPVYAWTRQGSDRVADQLYRVNHSGGATEVRINHRRVGQGWIYLGSYFFEAGTGGSVVISNQSSDPAGTVVIADAIRFGNGVGDIDRGFGISGHLREEEAARYWVQGSIGFGGDTTNYDLVGSNDESDNVGAPIRQAVDMNIETEGVMTDRIYLSFHTNASPGSLGLYNGNNNPATRTPNQFRWAELVGREVNDDLVALSPLLEVPWLEMGPNPGDVTLDRTDIEFGEINNLTINNEFDATIIESGGHGNSNDALNLRNPNVRNWIARACHQATVRYFNEFGGGALAFLPEPPASVRAVRQASGSVLVSWTAPVVDAIGGHAATGYVVYRSANGYGFDTGTVVSGGGTTSLLIPGIPSHQVTYFRVAATNAGGESMPSETVVCRPRATGPSQLLIVNGFDRFDRTTNPRQTGGPGIGGPNGGTQTYDRVAPRYNNSFDYVVQIAEAIEAHTPAYAFDSCPNEAITGGQVALGDYDIVLWILGEESTGDETFSAAEQTAVTSYLAAGGHLFVSGSEIGWDLDRDSGPTAADRTFYNQQLHADLGGNANDSAGTYTVAPVGGSIFTGNSNLTFDDGLDFSDNLVSQYNTDFADRLTPVGAGATAAMTYVGGSGGTAAIQYNGTGANSGRLVYLGFPFETITTASARNQVMTDVLTFFGVTVPVELSGFEVR